MLNLEFLRQLWNFELLNDMYHCMQRERERERESMTMTLESEGISVKYSSKFDPD